MKQARTHTADPSKDHHMIGGQLIPVDDRPPKKAPAAAGSSRRQPAKKNKGVEATKPTP